MGRLFRPNYTIKGPDGERIKKTSPNWHIQYVDANGKLIRRIAGRTKGEARAALTKAEADVQARKNGLPTSSIGDLLCEQLKEEYLADQKRHVCKSHFGNITRQLQIALAAMKVIYLKELTPEIVEVFLDDLEGKGLAQRTVNIYLSALRSMMNWAVRKRKIPYSPLDCICARTGREPRRVRRALSEEECVRLLKAGQEGPIRRMARQYSRNPIPPELMEELEAKGRRYVLIYTMLLQTGLRVGELRRLTWADLDFEQGLLYCRAEWTKNRKTATLPLHPSLVEKLQLWRDEQNAGLNAPVVKVPANLITIFHEDLQAAGIEQKNAAGQTVDPHALRHTFATRLNAAGVDPKTMQALMRHSSPVLTLAVYVHHDRDRMARAVKALPDIQPHSEEVTESQVSA